MLGMDARAHVPTTDVGKLQPGPGKKKAKASPEQSGEETASAPAPAEVEAAPTIKPSPRKDVVRAAPAIVPTRQGTIDREGLAARGMIVPGEIGRAHV